MKIFNLYPFLAIMPLFCAGLLLVAPTALASTDKADSLLKVLPSLPDTQKVMAFADISWEYRRADREKALEFANQALALAQKINYKKGLAQAYNDLGILYYDVKDYPQALEHYKKSLEIRELLDDQEGMASIYNKTGIIAQEKGDYDVALKNQLLCLNIYENLGNGYGMGQSLTNIAVIYRNEGNLQKAVEFLQKSIIEKEKINDANGLAGSYTNLANIYYDQNEDEKALDYYLLALKYLGNSSHTTYAAAIFNNLGAVYTRTGNYDKAKQYLEKALEIRTGAGDKKGIASTLVNMGSLWLELKNYAAASKNLLNAADISKSIGARYEQMSAYKTLAQVFEKTNDFKQSLVFERLYAEVKDSLLNEEKSRQIGLLRTKFETDKMEKELELLKQENEIHELSLAQQNMELQKFKAQLFVGILLVIVAAIIVSLQISRNRIKQQRLKELAVYEAKNEERRRIARDMHDDLGSGLSKIAVVTEIGKNANHEQVHEKLQSISHTSKSLLDNMGTLIWALNPDNSSLDSLISKMREFTFDFLEELPVKLESGFPSKTPEVSLASDYQRNIYLFFKEALNNAVKHASATKISVQVMITGGPSLSIAINDDGKGFDLEKTRKNGNGIQNMQARIEKTGGKIRIESSEGRGTQIIAEVPLRA